MHEPVLIRPLPEALPPLRIVIKSVGFFYESEVHQDVDVADDGTPREPAGVGYGLVPGEALIGFAVAVGEDDMERPPDRSTEEGEVAFGQLFENDPRILFLLAGFGLRRDTVGSA